MGGRASHVGRTTHPDGAIGRRLDAWWRSHGHRRHRRRPRSLACPAWVQASMTDRMSASAGPRSSRLGDFMGRYAISVVFFGLLVVLLITSPDFRGSPQPLERPAAELHHRHRRAGDVGDDDLRVASTLGRCHRSGVRGRGGLRLRQLQHPARGRRRPPHRSPHRLRQRHPHRQGRYQPVRHDPWHAGLRARAAVRGDRCQAHLRPALGVHLHRAGEDRSGAGRHVSSTPRWR